MSSEMREFIEQMDILADDFYKYQEGDSRVPFVVIRDAVVAAISAYQDCRALLARTEAGADGWPDIKPDGFDAREIAACNDIEQLRNWAGCMRRERDNWRHRAQDAELALSDTHPQDASGDAVAGRVNGYMFSARAIEIITDGDVPEWITKAPGLRVTIAAMQAKEAK